MKPILHTLALIALATTLVTAGVAQKAASKQGELRKELSEVRETKDDARKKLRTTRRQVRAVAGDIDHVDKRLGDIQVRLEQTSTRLESSRQEQEQLRESLSDATRKLAERQEQVRQRLRRMYVKGRSSVLTGLVKAQSLGELASKQYLYERVAEQDREIFADYKRLRAQVAERKQRQDEIVQRVSRLKQDQEVQKNDLAETKDEKQRLLQDLKGQQKELERLVAQLEAEERAIAAKLAAYARRGGSGLPAFTGRFSKPVNGPLTSGFGMRFHPILKRNRLHKGVDFGASSGSPIFAAADGIVISASYSSGYGNTVILDHGGGITTLYAHCSRLMVSAGERVVRGQTIAAVGSTGLSTGPHLHWEVRVNGEAVNPLGRL